VTRWWGVALLALSVGLNAGLAVAVLQQRFLPVAQPATPEPPELPDAPAGWAGQGAGEADGPARAARGPGAGEPLAADAVTVGERPAGAPDPDLSPDPAPQPESDLEAEPGVPELAWMAPDEPAAEPSRRPLPPAARRDGRFAPGPPEARLEEMAARLGVPEADRPRFVALQRRFFAETRDRRIRLDGTRRELRAELTAARPDRARIDEILARSSDLQLGLERSLVEHVLAAREVLDGEAERRYLRFLSRLGAAGGPGARAAPGLGRRPGLRGPGRRPPF
jgi:hypothetical protein